MATLSEAAENSQGRCPRIFITQFDQKEGEGRTQFTNGGPCHEDRHLALPRTKDEEPYMEKEELDHRNKISHKHKDY